MANTQFEPALADTSSEAGLNHKSCCFKKSVYILLTYNSFTC